MKTYIKKVLKVLSLIKPKDILDAVKNNKLKRSNENYVYPNEISTLIAMINNYKK